MIGALIKTLYNLRTEKIQKKSRETKKLLKSYKTEILPTPEQKQIIHKTIGVCRFVYNFYLAHNKEIYEKEEKFVSGYEFSVWLNKEYLPKILNFHGLRKSAVNQLSKVS